MTKTAKTAITMTVLCVVLLAMIVVGFKAATSPLPEKTTKTKCQVVSIKRQVVRKDITVSVYNGTKRKGLADTTMSAFERRKFHVGAVGNAPEGSNVQYVEVLSTRGADDPMAKLVAMQFEPEADVVKTADALGPGVDVVIGPQFKKLSDSSPHVYKLPKPVKTCADTEGAQ